MDAGQEKNSLFLGQSFSHQLFRALGGDQVESDQQHEGDSDVGHVLQSESKYGSVVNDRIHVEIVKED